jgi:hypothetical protein
MLRSSKQLRRLAAVAIVGALALVPLIPAGAASGPQVTSLVSGLNSPRGLVALGSDAAVVAEAGKGGSGPCGPGPLGQMCVGKTGAVTLAAAGQLNRLAHLSSIALEDGSFAFGPHDVALGGDGSFYATIGLAGNGKTRKQYGTKGAQLAHLVRVSRNGDVQLVADLLAYEKANDPDGGGVESDPYGLLRIPGARASVLTDAAANDLLRVTDSGDISTLSVFPDRTVDYYGDKIPMDAVPTSVVKGPDGAYYVGQLTGFPFPVGGARVFRVVPGQDPTVYASGFTNIIDIAFGPSGNLFVLEIAHNSLNAAHPYGALIRVTPGGDKKVLLDDGLFFPTSVALLGNGQFLVTNCGVCPGGGEILKVQV